MVVVLVDIARLIYQSLEDPAGSSEFPPGDDWIYPPQSRSITARWMSGWWDPHLPAGPSRVTRCRLQSGCGCAATNGPKSFLLPSFGEKWRVADQKAGAAHSAHPIKSLSCYRLTVYTPLTKQHSKKERSRCSRSPPRSLGGTRRVAGRGTSRRDPRSCEIR